MAKASDHTAGDPSSRGRDDCFARSRYALLAASGLPSRREVSLDGEALLRGGEMSMVNETIDLMEKEHVDASSLASICERANRLY